MKKEEYRGEEKKGLTVMENCQLNQCSQLASQLKKNIFTLLYWLNEWYLDWVIDAVIKWYIPRSDVSNGNLTLRKLSSNQERRLPLNVKLVTTLHVKKPQRAVQKQYPKQQVQEFHYLPGSWRVKQIAKQLNTRGMIAKQLKTRGMSSRCLIGKYALVSKDLKFFSFRSSVIEPFTHSKTLLIGCDNL